MSDPSGLMMNISFTDPQPPDNDTSTSIISPAEQLVLTIALAAIVFLGVVGNSVVVIIMLASKEHRKTSTNTFVFNLAIADLLFIVCCAPFQGSIYILSAWEFGRFICKSVHCFQYATMLASILILTFMAVERYAALTYPFCMKRFSTVFFANLISGGIWLFSFVSSVPWILLYNTHLVNLGGTELNVCYDYWGDKHYLRKYYILYFFLLGFLIPALVISTMSGLTATTILKHSRDEVPENRRHEGGISRRVSQAQKRRRVTAIIFAVAILFLICWLPHNVAIMWINFGDFGYTKSSFVFRVLTHIFTYVNSVLNPVLYALLSDNFRRILAKLFATNPFGGGNGEYHRGHRNRAPRNQGRESPGALRPSPCRHSGSPRHSPHSALAAILRELSLTRQTGELQHHYNRVGLLNVPGEIHPRTQSTRAPFPHSTDSSSSPYPNAINTNAITTLQLVQIHLNLLPSSGSKEESTTV